MLFWEDFTQASFSSSRSSMSRRAFKLRRVALPAHLRLLPPFHGRVIGFFLLSPSATWVRRPFEDDDDLQPPEGKIYLSDFQVEKFTYYFTDVFDHNRDQVITIEDIHALNEVGADEGTKGGKKREGMERERWMLWCGGKEEER